MKLARLMRNFDGYDMNKDGCIAVQEWLSMLTSAGMPESNARDLMRTADQNGDGMVEWSEFMALN